MTREYPPRIRIRVKPIRLPRATLNKLFAKRAGPDSNNVRRSWSFINRLRFNREGKL